MRPGQDYSLLSSCISAWLLEVVGETGAGLLVTLFLYLGLAAGGGGRDRGRTTRYSPSVSAWLLEVVGETGAGLLVTLLLSRLGCWRWWARPGQDYSLLSLCLGLAAGGGGRDRAGLLVTLLVSRLAAGGGG